MEEEKTNQDESSDLSTREEESQKDPNHLEELIEKHTDELKKEIAERKKMEEALRESEKKYCALVENSKDGVIIIQDGVLKFVNRASIEMVGSTKEEMIGTDFFASPWLFGFVRGAGSCFFAPMDYNSSDGTAPNPDF